MKRFKNFLLLISLLSISAKGFNQFLPSFVFQVQMNQCYTPDTTGLNGYSIDSVQLIMTPLHGTLDTIPAPFTYCPDSNFVGNDTVRIYACSPIFGIMTCDTFPVVFEVQRVCSLSVTLVPDTMICIGGNRSYMAVISGGIGSNTYQWSDGSSASAACEIAPTLGICVTVSDAGGCTASTCSTPNGCQFFCYIFYDTDSLGVQLYNGTPPYTYLWSDGSTSSSIYQPVSGTWCITATDGNGCPSVYCAVLNLGTGHCHFTYNTQNPLLGYQVNFYSVNDTAFTPVSWLWDFGDGTIDTASSPMHIFSIGGFYQVCMNVNYSNGDTCSYCEYIYAYPDSNNYGGCQAFFYEYIDSANTNTFHFADYSVYGPVTWAWDFGDGDTSFSQNPTHTYNSQGSWNVCLTITDSRGCSSNYCQQISNIPVQDVEAYLYHQTTVTPGFPVWVYLGYYNSGTMLMSGTIQYRYPEGTTVQATSVVPASHDLVNRLLTFNYSNLIPGTADYIYVDLDASASLILGSLAEDTLWVNPINGDVTPANNLSYVIDSVVGSWDPNDKAVSPKGEGDRGIVPLNTTELSYRIRFQNTGNGPAQQVVIRDAISNNIDLTSVKVTDASHEHTIHIIGNELVVQFDNINLPDSGSNYNASQGFVNINAKLKPGLTNGTQIFNTADIYFDFNTPVITNTVVTTLGSIVSDIGSRGNFDFAILPNPASNQIALRGEFEKGSVYEMTNQLGQVVLKGLINSNNTLVNTTDLSGSIYLVKVKSGEKTGVRKLVLAE